MACLRDGDGEKAKLPCFLFFSNDIFTRVRRRESEPFFFHGILTRQRGRESQALLFFLYDMVSRGKGVEVYAKEETKH